MCQVRKVAQIIRSGGAVGTRVGQTRDRWGSGCDNPPPVIADELTEAISTALEAADLPVPPRGVEVTPAKSREHGDWQTNAALTLAKVVGEAPREIAARLVTALEANRPPHVERMEIAGPGFVNFFLAPTWLHDVLRVALSRRRDVRARCRARGAADQPRVRVGQPDRPAARRRGSVGRRRRRGREPARVAGRRGPSRVLPQRRRSAARHLHGLADARATREPTCRTAGTRASTSSSMAEAMRAEFGDAVTSDQAREWGYATGASRGSGTISDASA